MKKITLLIILLVSALGFSQTQPPSQTTHGIPLTENVSNSNIKNESYYNSSEQEYFNNYIDDLNKSSILFNYHNDRTIEDSDISNNFENGRQTQGGRSEGSHSKRLRNRIG